MHVCRAGAPDARAMLARGAGARPEIPLADPVASDKFPTDSLLIPDAVVAASPPQELLRLVQKSQQARVHVAADFDDKYEHLVTGGRADEYPSLVERFQAKFAAITSNLDRAAAKLTAGVPGGAMVAGMITKVNDTEARRLELQLELQVLRQRLSISTVEGAMLAQEKARVKEVEASIKQLAGSVFETLEELAAEAADLDDE